MKTLVVVPTYNEAENVAQMTHALLDLAGVNLEVLIVDDASPDGTGKIADQLAAQNPARVHVMHRTGERGLGRAYVDGFRWALEKGFEAIVQMDCDFSHAPGDVPKLIGLMNEYDVAVGSRYTKGGKIDEEWKWDRLLLSWWANAIYSRVILGSALKDITAGFKCWRREVLETIPLQNIQAQGYIFQVEMAYLTEKLGYRIKEIPIYFSERKKGTSKMTIRIKIEAALRLWQIRWRYRNTRPIVSR